MTNTTKAWLLLIPAILVEVTASLALKGALEHPALYVVVVIGYLSGFVLLANSPAARGTTWTMSFPATNSGVLD